MICKLFGHLWRTYGSEHKRCERCDSVRHRVNARETRLRKRGRHLLPEALQRPHARRVRHCQRGACL